MLPEKYEDLLQRSCDKWNGAGKSWSEKEVATNGEESQTEVLLSHFTPHLTEERYHAWNYARPQETGRPGQWKEWLDDLVEWTRETIPDLVRKADWHFEDLFMRLPTLANRVQHLDWLMSSLVAVQGKVPAASAAELPDFVTLSEKLHAFRWKCNACRYWKLVSEGEWIKMQASPAHGGRVGRPVNINVLWTMKC